LHELTVHVQTTGPIETTACDFESVESVNEELYDHLHNLVQTPFFKFFRVRAPLHNVLSLLTTCIIQVDLYRECPFWQENVFCANQGCGITTVDEVGDYSPIVACVLRECNAERDT
jgi:ERO1-like protein beta